MNYINWLEVDKEHFMRALRSFKPSTDGGWKGWFSERYQQSFEQ